MISETLETFGGLHKVINQEFRNKVFDSDFALVLASFTGYNYKDRNGSSTFIKPTVIRNMLASLMGWTRDMPLDNDYNKRINNLWNPDNIYERAKSSKTLLDNVMIF